MRLRILLRVDLADGSHGLLFVTKMNAKLDRFFFEYEEVQHDNQDLEWNLQSINASPPARRLQLIVGVWHTDGHEKKRQTENLHENISRCSKTFVK